MNLGFDEITSINCFNLDSSLPYVNMSDLVEIHASDSETLLREEAEGEKENVPEDSEGEGEEEEEETNDKESEVRTTEDSGVATETAEEDEVVKKPSRIFPEKKMLSNGNSQNSWRNFSQNTRENTGQMRT